MSDLLTCQFCECQITENIGLEDRDKKLQNYMDHVSEGHPDMGFVLDDERTLRTATERSD
ncbi:hypothetical protein HTZ84_22325 [Haloterrigena sp. SYSU A558-1]|uniref:Uncharacterized protein n=1 Tax=Haloterrigena gelatinilytica TaxID=2741724 RepID=A0ABX2LIL0_9EURY|nr:hypothetical protein [Haloterrigena gelatinilytica]NUC75004.1 hypothetical protein [Haloterrigena gelatinilytica]